MGFYIRKYFKAGPLRFNLSKSGIGISAGVTGARIGTGPRGAYVHAGRYGLYYRKYLSSSRHRAYKSTYGSRSSSNLTSVNSLNNLTFYSSNKSSNITSSNPNGWLIFLGLIGLGVLIVFMLQWIPKHLIIVGVISSFILAIIILFMLGKKRLEANIINYKILLDSTFITSDKVPTDELVNEIINLKKRYVSSQVEQIFPIEHSVYNALLDKILDDKFISEKEAETIVKAEKILSLHDDVKNKIKKDIYFSAYALAIEDKKITKNELTELENLKKGLGISDDLISSEQWIINDLIRAQETTLPIPAIPRNKIPFIFPQKEVPYYLITSKILTRSKRKNVSNNDEYELEREGDLLVTNKRIILVNQGTTNIKFSEIAFINVDLYQKRIEINKLNSGIPVYIENSDPILTFRIIDLLMREK